MNAREIALKIIVEINEEGAFANIALDRNLAKYPLKDFRDRALVTDLVYGSIKYRKRLDWILDQFAKPKVCKMAPWIRNILRLGLYQIIFLDKVPISAAINESVKLAKKYGHRGTIKFVNGVLRNINRNLNKIVYPDFKENPVKYLSVYYSFPNWLVEKWVQNFGVENTQKLCEYFNNPSPLWIRTNTLKISRKALKENLLKENIIVRESERTPEGLQLIGNININNLESFKQGLFIVQDESSILVGHCLKPRSGQTIIDACSAPGGKTTHLAQLMDNEGRIIALDVHEHRLNLIKENSSRLGVDIISTIQGDARKLTEYLQEPVSGVLVDAPCSGLGVLGRRADARWVKTAADIEKLSEIQLEILQEAAKLVKKGGTLVYSTCTITKEENEDVIKEFLKNNPEFYLDKNLSSYLPYENEEGKEGYIKFLPFIHGIDGFFIARLKRM